jgi:hypothetical protein
VDHFDQASWNPPPAGGRTFGLPAGTGKNVSFPPDGPTGYWKERAAAAEAKERWSQVGMFLGAVLYVLALLFFSAFPYICARF